MAFSSRSSTVGNRFVTILVCAGTPVVSGRQRSKTRPLCSPPFRSKIPSLNQFIGLSSAHPISGFSEWTVVRQGSSSSFKLRACYSNRHATATLRYLNRLNLSAKLNGLRICGPCSFFWWLDEPRCRKLRPTSNHVGQWLRHGPPPASRGRQGRGEMPGCG